MTIDEAIKLEKKEQIKCENDMEQYATKLCKKHSKQNAEYHRQIAVWLEELKLYKSTLLTLQMIEDLKKSEKQAHKIAIQNAMLAEDSYNKALDDIVTIIKERVGMDWEWDFYFIEQIAEQLKAGGMNEYNI